MQDPQESKSKNPIPPQPFSKEPPELKKDIGGNDGGCRPIAPNVDGRPVLKLSQTTYERGGQNLLTLKDTAGAPHPYNYGADLVAGTAAYLASRVEGIDWVLDAGDETLMLTIPTSTNVAVASSIASATLFTHDDLNNKVTVAPAMKEYSIATPSDCRRLAQALAAVSFAPTRSRVDVAPAAGAVPATVTVRFKLS